ncbi:hypothetical protein BDV93DRAFT_585997 [Ceratobasidium sp. AG-I]|nr:hypothetical protein BDV93DRAFT_585997 [Ceratobasidium sp. AG-I]
MATAAKFEVQAKLRHFKSKLGSSLPPLGLDWDAELGGSVGSQDNRCALGDPAMREAHARVKPGRRDARRTRGSGGLRLIQVSTAKRGAGREEKRQESSCGVLDGGCGREQQEHQTNARLVNRQTRATTNSSHSELDSYMDGDSCKTHPKFGSKFSRDAIFSIFSKGGIPVIQDCKEFFVLGL